MPEIHTITLFDRHAPEVVDPTIEHILAHKKQGVPEPKIMQEVFTDWSDADADLVWEMMLARLQDKREPRVDLPLFMTRDDLRFATHRFIARRRAKRLACGTMVEVGCGIGSQTIEFAKTCKRVIAIEIDPRKVAFAKSNCDKLKIKNVEFICADGVEAIEHVEHADVVFCDPERAPEAKERTIDAFSPSIMGLLDACAHKTSDVAIELPPQMKDIPINGELEYASIEGKIARLTIYRGGLARCKRSAVSLPSGQSIQDTAPSSPIPLSESPLDFIFEVDEAVTMASLVDRLGMKDLYSIKDSKPLLLTSGAQESSPFFRSTFKLIAVINQKTEIRPALEKNGAGKAIIRYAIDPKDYWKERQYLEKGLEGDKHFHVFQNGQRFFLAEKVGEDRKS